MVKLNIIVEGGTPTNDSSAETANNSEALRQSLHKFFARLLDVDDIDITITMGQNYRYAMKKYVENGGNGYLFIDSDASRSEQETWFGRFINDYNPENTILVPDGLKDNVHFMIQEMEAWFLKQPDCLDRWAQVEGYHRKFPKENIADHSLIKGKDIESISKPSEKLAVILKKYFYKGQKHAKYGKLRTAPTIIDQLRADELLSVDAELKRFSDKIIRDN